MSLPSRITQIASTTAAKIVQAQTFLKGQQTATNLIVTGTVQSLNGSIATVSLDNGNTLTVTLTNNQYLYVGALVAVAGGTIVV